LIKFPPI